LSSPSFAITRHRSSLIQKIFEMQVFVAL
jgi:hypothetical protein